MIVGLYLNNNVAYHTYQSNKNQIRQIIKKNGIFTLKSDKLASLVKDIIALLNNYMIIRAIYN
jgi:hypothetical protein